MRHRIWTPNLRAALLLGAIAMTVQVSCRAASLAPVAAEHGMVVTAQHLASRVGVDVL
jgi:gamma-glutamyltranspeptidase/glutathione hydrolase